jgi:hypothetical protein
MNESELNRVIILVRNGLMEEMPNGLISGTWQLQESEYEVGSEIVLSFLWYFLFYRKFS